MPLTAGPAENVFIQFAANGSATYPSIEQWIFAKEDITVYFDQALQAPATYSISVPTSAGYDITFSAPPIAPVLITILRRIIISDPENFAPGASLTAEDLNTRFDAAYLIETDNSFYSTHIEPTYGDVSLTYPPGSPKIPVNPGDLILPVLATPGATEAPRVWAKDSSGVMIDAPLDPGGKSAAELETELASATSPTASGANMIGYWNGTSEVTVQDTLDGTVANDIAHYTDNTSKNTIMNGAYASDGTSRWQQVEIPSSVADYTSASFFGDGSGAGAMKMYTSILGTAVRIYTAGTTVSGAPATAEWTQGSPNPTVPATSILDTTLATRGYCYGTTPKFTKEATAAAAKAAAAADTNPLHFYWSPIA